MTTNHTPLPEVIQVWPTHWAGGSNSITYDGHPTIWLNGDGSEVARIRTDGGRVTEKTYIIGNEIAKRYNAHAELVEALKLSIPIMEREEEYAKAADWNHDPVFSTESKPLNRARALLAKLEEGK